MDYYPFGLEMNKPDTDFGEFAGYRFGFNGKEADSDSEWGSATHYDYGFRIYNPSIGKFLSVDPLAPDYPMLTPYQFASNTPIQAIDLDGLEAFFIHGTYSTSERWKTYLEVSNKYVPGENTKQLMRLTNNSTADLGFEWGSGRNNPTYGNFLFNDRDDRERAAQSLTDYVLSNLKEGEDISLIGHSHGGNVAIQAARMIRKELDSKGFENIEINLITLSTPSDNTPGSSENPSSLIEEGIIASHVHIYSNKDAIISLGATLFGTSGLAPY